MFTRFINLSFKGIEDHFEICQSLRNLSGQELKELGGALGLHYPRVSKMTQLPDEMVSAWLKRQDDVLTRGGGEPTWNRLADALNQLGHTGTAEDIRRRKCDSSTECQQQKDMNPSKGTAHTESRSSYVHVHTILSSQVRYQVDNV